MNPIAQAIIHPSGISGTITAPVSKSAMQRACAAALLHKGETIIYNPGRSNDDAAALNMIQQLGAQVADENNRLYITGNGVQPVNNRLQCGESGLGVRMFTPIAALAATGIMINGSGSLLNRPMNFFDEVLPQLGVTVHTSNGLLPVTVCGPLVPADITIDGSLSSQFLTGLLMAYGAAQATGVTITVNRLASKPYIDLTLNIMRHFGMHTPVNNNYSSFVFAEEEINGLNKTVTYTVEGDWSGAAFLLVAGAIAGTITITGLDINSTQADKKILEVLKQSGAVMNITRAGITIQQSALTAFETDATDCPDLFPPLVSLAAYANGRSIIKGVNRLAHKESNRGLTLQSEFGKMGVPIIVNGDEMMIEGGGKINGATVHSGNDHRIAMACAVAGLQAIGAVTILGADAVNKSYPGFYNDLCLLGAAVSGPTASV